MFLDGGGSAFSSRPFAEQTQASIDREVARLVREAEQRAVEVLKEHRKELDALVELLLDHETVDGAQVYAVAGRPAPEAAGGGMTMAPDRASGTSRPPAKSAAERAEHAERAESPS